MDLRSAGLKREDLTKMPEGKAQFHILVVEDEAKVARALREGLTRERMPGLGQVASWQNR